LVSFVPASQIHGGFLYTGKPDSRWFALHRKWTVLHLLALLHLKIDSHSN
jgi:hypothetical protein